jgi:large subunit ribosomal protein L19
MEANSKAAFKVGDIIKVTTRDPKAGKVHATPFEGIVMGISGSGESKTFTIRKVASGNIAIERIFPLHSPAIEKISVVKPGHVRRAKLTYLRKKLSK